MFCRRTRRSFSQCLDPHFGHHFGTPKCGTQQNRNPHMTARRMFGKGNGTRTLQVRNNQEHKTVRCTHPYQNIRNAQNPPNPPRGIDTRGNAINYQSNCTGRRPVCVFFESLALFRTCLFGTTALPPAHVGGREAAPPHKTVENG